MSTFRLPDLGEGLQEAELLEWLVATGDEVEAGQPLARVETDKAQVDVASPRTGRIARLHGEPGDRVRVGDLLVEFEQTAGTKPLAEAAADVGANEAAGDAGTLVGRLPGPAPTATRALRTSASPASVRAMPAARKRARSLGIPLDSVVGTGPEGVITRADVEQAAAADRRESPGDVAEPLRGVRLAMAHHMAKARDAVAPATLMEEVDVEAWWSPKADVAVRLLRGMTAACAAEPALNASFDDRRAERILHEQVDVAIAIQTREGLFAPVLRDVARATPAQLRAGIDGLVAQTRARSLRPEDLRNGTITLSNFGSLGGRHAVLVVVPPQVAIVGAGRVERRVVAHEEQIAVRAMLPLSLTFDHRVVTGAEAARFVAAMREDLARAD